MNIGSGSGRWLCWKWILILGMLTICRCCWCRRDCENGWRDCRNGWCRTDSCNRTVQTVGTILSWDCWCKWRYTEPRRWTDWGANESGKLVGLLRKVDKDKSVGVPPLEGERGSNEWGKPRLLRGKIPLQIRFHDKLARQPRVWHAQILYQYTAHYFRELKLDVPLFQSSSYKAIRVHSQSHSFSSQRRQAYEPTRVRFLMKIRVRYNCIIMKRMYS